MTIAHLVFAVATTGYILIAIQLEERDLVEAYGNRYEAYRSQVSMLMPRPPKKPCGSRRLIRWLIHHRRSSRHVHGCGPTPLS